MSKNIYSHRIQTIEELIKPVSDFITDSQWAQRAGDPNVCDFALGNPHEQVLPAFVSALQRWSVPQNKDWFAYKGNEPEAQAVIADALRARRNLPFSPDDIFLTNGSFAALSVALMTVTEPGDEVIFISPPWFFYEALITAVGATAVRVEAAPDTLTLDPDAVAAAITPRTRAVIVNSPNNPTGKIYAPETLEHLAKILRQGSERIGHTIYLLSDEAYSRILYDGREFASPTAFYPNAFLIYTYGKTLLTPGQRLGYIALPPTMDESRREQLRPAIYIAQFMMGYAFPNALLQHALPEIEELSIDVGRLQHKRDRLVAALREMGYDARLPDATFYVLVKSPLADDQAFIRLLAEHDIFCLPGTVIELPGYFRISLTATEEMIDRALPGFAAAMEQAQELSGRRRG
ncbi:MAG: aminotransferase class I/II-fold pyridoxal phosphate-dependent enzyme [Anaerolineae bacterium]|jgi:aspartate aminotransferase